MTVAVGKGPDRLSVNFLAIFVDAYTYIYMYDSPSSSVYVVEQAADS